MTISLNIEGELLKGEKIKVELNTPTDWQPNIIELTSVLGVLNILKKKLIEHYGTNETLN